MIYLLSAVFPGDTGIVHLQSPGMYLNPVHYIKQRKLPEIVTTKTKLVSSFNATPKSKHLNYHIHKQSRTTAYYTY